MRFIAGPLQGLYVIELQPFRDVRGFFARTFCAREFADAGLVTEWVQINHSMNVLKGTLRGLHYQNPPHAEVKLVRCIRGSVLDVVQRQTKRCCTFLRVLHMVFRLWKTVLNLYTNILISIILKRRPEYIMLIQH